MPREPVLGAAMGDDVEEAQELAVKAPPEIPRHFFDGAVIY